MTTQWTSVALWSCAQQLSRSYSSTPGLSRYSTIWPTRAFRVLNQKLLTFPSCSLGSWSPAPLQEYTLSCVTGLHWHTQSMIPMFSGNTTRLSFQWHWAKFDQKDFFCTLNKSMQNKVFPSYCCSLMILKQQERHTSPHEKLSNENCSGIPKII